MSPITYYWSFFFSPDFLSHLIVAYLNVLGCFQERAHDYYNGMTKEQFKKMQEFIAGRGAKKPSPKL